MQSGAAGQSLRSRQRGGGHRAGAIDAAGRAARPPRLALPGALTQRHPTLGRPLSRRARAGAEPSKSARENALYGIVMYRRPLRLNEYDAVGGPKRIYRDDAERRAPLSAAPVNRGH